MPTLLPMEVGEWVSGPETGLVSLTLIFVLRRVSARLREREREVADALLFDRSSVEWQITDMACGAFSLVSVALYDTLGPVSRVGREETKWS